MIEERIMYLGEFGQGPFKFYQILNGSVKLDDIKKVDYCTPTLNQYWEEVKQLVNEALEVKQALSSGLSPLWVLED